MSARGPGGGGVPGAVWLALGAGIVLSVGAQAWLVEVEPGLPWWHAFPGVQAGYGFAGGVALVLVSKWLGHHWLLRPEAPDEAEAASGDRGDGAAGPARGGGLHP